jgi:hypothetical protein
VLFLGIQFKHGKKYRVVVPAAATKLIIKETFQNRISLPP